MSVLLSVNVGSSKTYKSDQEGTDISYQSLIQVSYCVIKTMGHSFVDIIKTLLVPNLIHGVFDENIIEGIRTCTTVSMYQQ